MSDFFGGGLGNAISQVRMTHQFVVVIDHPAYDLGTWSKVSGLSVSWAPCEYRAGDAGNQVWILPGNTKYEKIKLSRAACSDSQIVQAWLAQTSKNPAPLSGTIVLIDFLETPVVYWRLSQFFPIGWSIVEFDAAQGRPAIETLELAHTGFLDDDFSLPS
jgi:phage tail-like protein